MPLTLKKKHKKIIIIFTRFEGIFKIWGYKVRQMTQYLESNKLPNNQHVFRSKRSTMSAWETIQQDWATKTEE